MRTRVMTAILAVAAILLGGCWYGDPLRPLPPPLPSVLVGAPVGLATVNGALWAVSSADGTVDRIDPITRMVTQTVTVGDTPLRAAVDGDLLWVSVFRSDTVVAVDTRTGKIVHRTTVGAGPEGVAVGFGSIWVVSQGAYQLTRLDLTGHILTRRTVDLGTPRLVAVGPHGVYVTDYSGGTVTRFDRTGAHPSTTPKICDGAQAMSIVDGTIWLACTAANQVVALDEKTLRQRGRMTVVGQPDGIRIVGDTGWIACATGPELVDFAAVPDAPRFIGRTVVGRGPALDDQANVDVESLNGKLWVSSFRDDAVFEITPPH